MSPALCQDTDAEINKSPVQRVHKPADGGHESSQPTPKGLMFGWRVSSHRFRTHQQSAFIPESFFTKE